MMFTRAEQCCLICWQNCSYPFLCVVLIHRFGVRGYAHIYFNLKFGTTEEVAVCPVFHGHWILVCPSKQKVQQNNKKPLGKYARSQSWPLYEISHFFLEAAYMILGAGWTAPPGRIEGERGRRGGNECLHLRVNLGGLQKVTSPPGKDIVEHRLCFSVSWPCAPRLPCYSQCLPTMGWTTKPHMCHSEHIWLKRLHAVYCFISFGFNFGSMVAPIRRY